MGRFGGRLVVGLLVLAGLVVGVLAWLQPWAGGLAVAVARAEQGMLREYVDERAKTRLPRVYRVSMPIDGRVLPLTVDEGEEVSQGQVIAELDTADLELRIEEAEAELQRIQARIRENADIRLEEAQLEGSDHFLESMDRTVEAALEKIRSSEAREKYYQRELERIQSLFESNSASEADLNRAQLDAIEAEVDLRTDRLNEAALLATRAAMRIWPRAIRVQISQKDLAKEVLEQEAAAAAARLSRLRLDFERSQVRSPVDGVVLETDGTSERVLTAGAELLTLGRLAELEIEAEVLTQDAVAIAPGDRVEIYGATIGPEPIYGEVRKIEPQAFTKVSSLGIEEQRVRVIIGFEKGALATLAERERRLMVDYRVRVRVFTAEDSQALRVPRSALFRGGAGQWQAYVVREGRARLVDVTVGLGNDDWYQVTSGIEPGEQVVVAPDAEISDGIRVDPNVLEDRVLGTVPGETEEDYE